MGETEKMTVAICGASGFVGTYLTVFFKVQGYTVVPLGRNVFAKDNPGLLPQLLQGCDVVINLAGAPINRRWSQQYKKKMYESRICVTRQLVSAINDATAKPALLISASAVGYYPDKDCFDEDTAVEGEGFLAALCAQWEAEARKVCPQVRLAITRFGVVLSPRGGALLQLLQPFRMKVAVRIGDGSQFFPWIDIEDVARAMLFLMTTPALHGVFNFVAPQQLTGADMTAHFGRYYHTLVTVGVPAFVFRMALGEGAQLVTKGQCVQPARLLSAGFHFASENIDEFIRRNCR